MKKKNNSTIYVGNLPCDFEEHEVEHLFEKYGPIVEIDMKKSRDYAFVQFESRRDALEAIEGRNECVIDGYKLRVELSSGMWGPMPPLPRRTIHRVLVKNLPVAVTWQQLKDHMKMAGTVCFADIKQEGECTVGLVEYLNESMMNYSIQKLNHSKLSNKMTHSRITVEKYSGSSNKSEMENQDVPKATVQRDSHQAPGPTHKHSRSQSSSPPIANKRRKV